MESIEEVLDRLMKVEKVEKKKFVPKVHWQKQKDGTWKKYQDITEMITNASDYY